MIDESPQSIGEDGPGDVEVAAEVVEPSDPTKRIAQDQNRPPVAEDVEAPLDRARSGVGGDGVHRVTVRRF